MKDPKEIIEAYGRLLAAVKKGPYVRPQDDCVLKSSYRAVEGLCKFWPGVLDKSIDQEATEKLIIAFQAIAQMICDSYNKTPAEMTDGDMHLIMTIFYYTLMLKKFAEADIDRQLSGLEILTSSDPVGEA